MNRSMTWILCAVALLTLPFAWWPQADARPERRTGTVLGRKVEPTEVGGLRIAGWSQIEDLVRVADLHRADGTWVVATGADGLPVNGNTRASQLAGLFGSLTTGRLATRDPARHAALKVLDPLGPWDPALDPAQSLGIRVTITARDGSPVNDFIIGASAEGSGGSLYVRPAGHDEVYLVRFDPREITFRLHDLVSVDPLENGNGDLRALTVQTAGGPVTRLHLDPGSGDWQSPDCPPGTIPAFDALKGIMDVLEYLPVNGARRRAAGTGVADAAGILVAETADGRRVTIQVGGPVGSATGLRQGRPAPVPSRIVQIQVEDLGQGNADPGVLARQRRVYDSWAIEIDAKAAEQLLPPLDRRFAIRE